MDDNFESTLSDHFENKRFLIRAYLTSFTSLPRMKPESVSDLRRIFHGMVDRWRYGGHRPTYLQLRRFTRAYSR